MLELWLIVCVVWMITFMVAGSYSYTKLKCAPVAVLLVVAAIVGFMTLWAFGVVFDMLNTSDVMLEEFKRLSAG